ncbi:serine O-acetyltransferase [Aureimonas frigidaquae]|uniref:Serine acetyltransferase n=1 Tax=Aureimonas frigidaquae TaxID=424757 RepID=A0A0N7KY38_9HYPH|nr:serine acetyltransferase [Aureimonas frigidaquae]BAT28641.1 serine acetyltransferase [Aureimonas frigidaquae]
MINQTLTPPLTAEALPSDADPDLFAENDGYLNCNPRDIAFHNLVAEDFRTHGSDAFSQGFWVLFWHRFGNRIRDIRFRPARMPLTLTYKIGNKLSEWMAGVMLPYTVRVGRRVRLEHFGGMILIAQSIGNDVTIRQNTTFGIARTDRPFDRPVIADGVDIGTGAVIIGRVWVGEGAVIGANAVVTRHVPPHAVMAGVPARRIDVEAP